MKTIQFSSRGVLGVSLAFAAALGCSEKITVVNPQPPDQPTTIPVFNGSAIQSESPPIPISGGTLITMVHPDGSAIAIASDPEEDTINVVALGVAPKLLGTLSLQPGDEPGRLVADAAGRVHVSLRRGGAVATIMPTATGASLLARRNVCSAPRGLDYDAATDSVFVACATGELVSLPAAGGDATMTVQVERDLRDVVVDGSKVYVTRFRSAEILTLDKTGALQNRTIPQVPQQVQSAAAPDVMWRAIHTNKNGLLGVHQIASNAPIDVATPPGQSSYGGSQDTNQFQPGGVVSVAVSSYGGGTIGSSALVSNPVVDIAVSPLGQFETISIDGRIETSMGPMPIPGTNGLETNMPDEFVAIADAQAASNPAIVVQRRGSAPALLVIPTMPNQPLSSVSVGATIPLPQRTSHVDTGLDVFHMPTSAGVACMNCHPEGGDDSHTWTFSFVDSTRVRRTQSLRGGVITPSAPYHWDGDMTDLQKLCDEVFTHRMGGGSLSTAQTPVLARFINSMPRIPVRATLDETRVAQGKTLFEGTAGCTACHAGGTGTLQENQNIGKIDSIGASAPLQVPMLLGVADRAPYMHDGCAATLLDRFNDASCAGSAHGNTANLSDDDKQNLVEYLESL